jgi:transcriptional regulator with XRE-family HTH domain
MTLEERRRPAVGGQVKRWRTERGMTLANVAERTDLNIGYLSQIENDKASPSLACLAAIGDALDVPIAWFFLGDVPAPNVVRAAERPTRSRDGLGRIESVDGGDSRDLSMVEGVAQPGGRAGLHAHAGDEHHLILRGRWRMTQGDHVIELGPGDYLRWDGTIPHDAEVIGNEEGHVLIVTLLERR